MSKTPTILIVEDEDEMRRLLEDVLRDASYTVLSAADGNEALDLFQRHDVDVIVSDLFMPGMKGSDLLAEIHTRRSDVPMIIITAFGSIESAVDAMKGGAYHYLTKPFRMEELQLVVAAALRERHLMQELAHLRREFATGASQLVAHSAAMQAVVATVTRAAAADTPVLILGESGTGKEMLARILHTRSPRLGRPFMAINCAAIPETLLESQLFGHRRGAFTDAREDRPGLFQQSQGGTVFLDEIGDMPLSLQAKLLRVLQEKEVHPVGALEPVPVDVRIVAATHRDLPALMDQGRFREDLFYRLNVISVRIPPLRERPEDLIPLLAHLLEKHGRRLEREGCTVAPEALEALRGYRWPGNVRELENVVERALVLGSDNQIGLDDLPEVLLVPRRASDAEQAAATAGPQSLATIEREHILRTLRAVGGNKAAAARILGMDRKTLYRKLEGYRDGESM